jgi:hypothetical protein
VTTAADGLLWLPEVRLLKLAGVSRSTYQSWASEELIARPSTGAYYPFHLVEAVLCGAIRAKLPLVATKNAMRDLRETDMLGAVVDRVRDFSVVRQVDLVIELEIAEATLCVSDEELLRAVRDPARTRTSTVTPLGDVLARAMRGFHNQAEAGAAPEIRKRGRPAKSAPVIRLVDRGAT